MTSEIDIYRSAHTLIEQHGEGAAIQAAMGRDILDLEAHHVTAPQLAIDR